MRLLASAQPFGFGPVSKLVSLSAKLREMDVTFAGHSIALRYARLNGQHLAEVIAFDVSDIAALRHLLRPFDAAMSVMEPHLVYAAVREGRQVYFFDSLLDFWINQRSYEELAFMADCILTGTERSADAAFHSLSVHESMIVSHMIASRSYAQAFPGVSNRAGVLNTMQRSPIQITGSMIDFDRIRLLRRSTEPTSRTLLVNIGGFSNYIIDGERRAAYVDIMMRWLDRLASKTRDFDEIIVCSGAFSGSSVSRVGTTTIRVGLLSHSAFLQILAGTPVYLTCPGLTSLHEAAALSVAPMLLPDQHYGHTCNRRRLSHTSLAARGASFSALDCDADLPDDDVEGTLALAALAERVHDDPMLFDRFAAHMDDALEAFRQITIEESRALVREVRHLLDGVPIEGLLAAMTQDISRAACVAR